MGTTSRKFYSSDLNLSVLLTSRDLHNSGESFRLDRSQPVKFLRSRVPEETFVPTPVP